MNVSNFMIVKNYLFSSLFQQMDVVATTDWNPNYIIAIISGVLLALAFQLILTALSVAIGITSIGNLKQQYVDHKVGTNSDDDESNTNTYDQDHSTGTSMGVKITSAFGIWSVITTCLSLFGATAIAIRMSIFSIDGTDIATGLVIWALFFIILFYVEIKAANTVIGGLVNTALASIRGTSSALKDALTPSDATKLSTVIEKTVSTVRNEFKDVVDPGQINDTVNKFFKTMDQKLPDYDKLINDLEGVVGSSGTKSSSNKWVAVQQVIDSLADQGNEDGDQDGQSKTEKLKSLSATIQKKYNKGDTTYDSLANVVEALTPADKEKIDSFYNKFKEYFSNTDDNGMDVKAIQSKLQEIFKDPTVLTSMIGNNIKELNRDSIIALLDKNTSIDKQQLDSYADKIEEQLEHLKKSYNSKFKDGILPSIEKSIEDFFNSTEKSEIQYDTLKDDFSNMLNNPNDSLSIIKNRLSKTDSNTLKALLTNNRFISDKNIDDIVTNFETAKQEVTDKVNSVQKEIDRRIENIKRQAVIKAEHTRKTAASAAWWLVITAVLSALAAIGGSAIAI